MVQCTSIACIMHDPAKGNMRKGGNRGASSYFWALGVNAPFVRWVGWDSLGAIGGQSTKLVLSACSGCLEQQGVLCKSTSILLSAELESFVLGDPEFRREGGLLLLSMLCLFTSA